VKVVVDTNVLMSGIFFGGTPGRIVDALKLGQITLAASPSIVSEYQRVGEDLETNYGELGAASLLTFLLARADVIDTPDLPEPVSRDPDTTNSWPAPSPPQCHLSSPATATFRLSGRGKGSASSLLVPLRTNTLLAEAPNTGLLLPLWSAYVARTARLAPRSAVRPCCSCSRNPSR
jgi:hypothetical protein